MKRSGRRGDISQRKDFVTDKIAALLDTVKGLEKPAEEAVKITTEMDRTFLAYISRAINHVISVADVFKQTKQINQNIGKMLFDMNTGTMSEGIGHYGYKRDSSEQNRIISVSHNPYPCAFDRGIITAMARKFQHDAVVTHDDSKECRSHGKETCTYIITW